MCHILTVVYVSQVDMWGAGCVVAELLTLSPLFLSHTLTHTLYRESVRVTVFYVP